jgi:hypothetical protein
MTTNTSTGVGSNSITTLGIITIGVWNGSIIPFAFGGTNVSSVTTSPTATAFAGWDSNLNLSANNYISGYATTATAAGTTTLTVSSAEQQYFTGTTTQTVLMPVVSTPTLKIGQTWTIVNNSTGSVTVQSSGANNIVVLASGTQAVLTCISNTGTSASSWVFIISYKSGGPITAVTGSGNISSSGGTTPNITFTGLLPLANGGSNANLTASNGGIVWSNATQMQILSGTSTALQMLQSGANATPSWSTSTYPATNAINTLLYASAANVMSALATANSSVLVTNGTGVPTLSTTLPSGISATNMSLTTPSLGTPSSGTLTSCTGLPLTTGVTGILPLANGGTAANLTASASNGGIVWSNATQMQILAGTSTANQLLISGASATPSWTSFYADYSSSSSANNLFMGTGCGKTGLTTNGNTGCGYNAFNSITNSASSSNTAFGTNSFKNLNGPGALAGGNAAFGTESGEKYTNYTTCSFFGAYADATVDNLINACSIGYNATVSSNNTMVLGNSSLTTVSTVANIITTGYVAGVVSKGSWYSTTTYNPNFSAGTAKLTPPSSATAGTLVNFTHSNGILTYTGARTRTMRFQYDIQLTLGANGTNMTYWNSINGGTSLGAQTRTGNTVTLLNTGLQITTSFSDLITMNTNDTIQLVGQCSANSTSVGYNYVQCNVYEIGD